MLLLAAFLCAAPAFHDGDNIRCDGGRAMRLAGIDAPEVAGSPKCQSRRGRSADCDYAAGARSRDHLRRIAAGRRVTCERVSIDVYGRPLVNCSAAGVGDLGEAQVRAGQARRWQ
ncbi:MAG TPA: thermonuclease family protein [Allosphingosinicella sp.]|jgi:endonuclease YncB( thermonuclease family)